MIEQSREYEKHADGIAARAHRLWTLGVSNMQQHPQAMSCLSVHRVVREREGRGGGGQAGGLPCPDKRVQICVVRREWLLEVSHIPLPNVGL